MNKKIYRVQNGAGLFWTGSFRNQASFASKGESWKNLSSVTRSLEYYVNYLKKDIPADWKVVEFEIVETPVQTVDLTKTREQLAIKEELKKVNYSFARFYDQMESRKCADKIEYILKLAPGEGKRWVDMDRIIEARSQLRELGVKTRTFREYQGMFGMMDHEQALRARLSLDVEAVCDVKEITKTVRERLASNGA